MNTNIGFVERRKLLIVINHDGEQLGLVITNE